MNSRGFVIAMLGARRHYAVPAILHRAGLLDRFHSDLLYLSPPMIGIARALPFGRRIASRSSCDIPRERLHAHPWLGVQYAIRRRIAHTRERQIETYVWAGRTFGSAVARSADLKNGSHAYAFHGAAKEILEIARERASLAVLEQTIAPLRSEHQLYVREAAMLPNLFPMPAWTKAHEALAEREEQEWHLADLILCGSDFVRMQMTARNATIGSKLAVVPYGFQSAGHALHPRKRTDRQIHVLFAGNDGWRKGLHRLLIAAGRLPKDRFSFRIVGEIDPRIRQMSRASNVSFIGSVPRPSMADHFLWADLLCLPSLCEGSAMVTYEALSFGVPVVTTVAAGSPVRHGVDGWIIRDRGAPTDELTSALFECADRLHELQNFNPEAYSLEAYERRLTNCLHTLLERDRAHADPDAPRAQSV